METKPKILLVDDETAITENLKPFLERCGFVVSVATNGEAALAQIGEFVPDIIILDVIMPRLDGRDTLRRLRRSNNWIPVILLTHVGTSTERAMALEEGADDYLNKPFDPHELVARIHVALRRVRSGAPSLTAARRLSSGELVLDRYARRVLWAAKEVALTPKAVNLLEYLMTHPDEMISRERLLDAVWGWDYPAGIRAVDTRIAELRRVLGDDASKPSYIETVSGEGYRFIGEVSVIS